MDERAHHLSSQFVKGVEVVPFIELLPEDEEPVDVQQSSEERTRRRNTRWKCDVPQDMEAGAESTTVKIQELQVHIEKIQNQQVEDGRDMSKQQKTTERYHTER
ncbi:hypothetical protein D9756_004563 [Leucocoprinus leucothites]|uniref:Uncharacterized protein n=1 Tax=Leucocoprinus leucothites TaxID=201217 RepID=A0A8H5LK89_9AGAR|nr:hypothetical protein D9756_004563 [Leucoagaricus leucothites]